MRTIYSFVAVALMLTLTLATPAFAEDGRYIVKFHPGRGQAATAAVQAAGGRLLLELGPQDAVAVELPLQAVTALRANPNVEYVEDDSRRYPLSQTTPWGIKMVQADQVGDASAANRLVCIVDSGYSRGHEDLAGDASVNGSNDSKTGSWFVDKCGHGTHVAGTVSALTNDRGVVGVMGGGNIRLHIVKVFGDSCSWTYSSNLIAALNECRNAGANVVSMSLGCNGPLCRSTTEESAFNNAYNAGVLSVAAAGNSGNTTVSYPAGYASVVSVAAVDSAKLVASFSQRNSTVELAAPGVSVRSTVPTGTGADESLSVGGVGYEAVAMQGSVTGSGTGPLFDCGLGTSACTGAAGKVCLIQRGTNSFADKVQNCQAGGGVAAVIYNNANSLFSGTLGSTVTTIPSVGISGVDGNWLKSNGVGTSATVTTGPGDYAYFDGTSMATPHVSGVAALVWSYNPGWTNAQIRQALQATAEDLGSAGRDNSYGYGLVRAKAALCYLNPGLALCGAGGGNNPPAAAFTFTCTDLACSFNGSGSSDSDGTIATYTWTFGDGSTGSGATVNHTYATGGTYSVTLKVTDNGGASDSKTANVTVTGPPAGGISLSVTGYKEKGLQKARLTWSGATTDVDIYRNESPSPLTTTASSPYIDNIDTRGGGTYTYKVCEAGTTKCSNSVTITF